MDDCIWSIRQESKSEITNDIGAAINCARPTKSPTVPTATQMLTRTPLTMNDEIRSDSNLSDFAKESRVRISLRSFAYAALYSALMPC